MPPDLSHAQHDRPQRQYRSTRVRYDEQKLMHERENAGQTSSKQPNERDTESRTAPINTLLMLFFILCILLVSYGLIREYHIFDPELRRSVKQMVSPG